mmetsp:Transcript_23766/g.44118  ORF Transcript_23766/g.44118 Transcript_23766/m.44118 type:complete len:425 (+) Transcript_23766:235-1509(+)
MATAVDSALEYNFRSAVDHLKHTKTLEIGNDLKLRFYGLFKQATEGDCNATEPSRFNVVARAKWSAWNDLKGMEQKMAREEYTKRLKALDPTFELVAAGKDSVPTPALKVESQLVASSNSSSSSSQEKLHALDKATTPGPGSTRFYLTASFCTFLLLVGVGGFLRTTLSDSALGYLGLVISGVFGIGFAIIQLVDDYGLIALYSPTLRRVLLERTLVEVILDGTIMQKFNDFITEISPVFYCKTPEDRVAALQNMSEKTRRLMTTKGVVNVLPTWQQKLLLSRHEALRQRQRCADDKVAFRPALSQGLNGSPAPLRTKPELEAQRVLASKLLRKSILDRIAKSLVSSINPEFCAGASAAMVVSLALQLKLSPHARRVFAAYVRSSALFGSSAAAVSCAVLVFLHHIASRYRAMRERKMKQTTLE